MKVQAKVCEFSVTCPVEECGQEVSYSDKLCSHVIVKGITNMEIQEQVLTLAAMEQDLTLKRITEFMYAQDTGRKSRKLLSKAGSLNKLRQHKMQQREQSNTMPGNVDMWTIWAWPRVIIRCLEEEMSRFLKEVSEMRHYWALCQAMQEKV